MPMDTNNFTIEFGIGTIEMVECGNEALFRVPLLIDGEEAGDIIVSSEDEEE